MYPNRPGEPGGWHQPQPPQQPEQFNKSLGSVPKAFWVGLGIGVLAFVVTISSRQVRSGSEGYSCSYHNYAGYVAAAAIAVCLVAGWVARSSAHPRVRLSAPLMAAISVVLLVLAIVHVLRGTGTIQNACDSHPLP